MLNKELIDRAWACLPKEFKEEVKRNFQLTDANCIAYEILIDLFGIHNLTSDAEEEEILTVSRKKVQEFYAKCKEVTKNPYSCPDYSHESALSRMALLDILFGSKCLPDEDAYEDNFAKSEPKPAEPKFHVGQRVRCLNDGETYIVLAKVGKHHYSLQGVEHDVHEDYLEPYTEPTDLNKSSETCTDNCSSQNHFVVKDEMVDNIIKDGFKNHNRLNIAAMAMQGILSNIDLFKNVLETGMETLGGDGISFRAVAKSSFLFADALINEAEEGDSK